MLTSKISLYDTHTSKECKIQTVNDYVQQVKYGTAQDAVLQGRAAKQRGDIETYKKIKSQSICVTPTGFIESGKSKEKKNLTPNGLVCVDIDTELTEEQFHSIYCDQYSFIVHKSFGGEGICVFVKIDPSKLDDAYNAISKYYYDTYNIQTDKSCSNSNRLRYLSYDPDIVVNEKSKKFNVKIEKKDIQPKQISYVFTDYDFQNILDQIKERHIDLCQEDYYRYIRIGLAIASKFGDSGEEYFHFVCSFGSKYNEKDARKDYKGFVANGNKVSIGTFYYYCKEAGIEVYSERTKEHITRVKVSKQFGNPTVESVSKNLVALGVEPDEQLINTLINSNEDFSKLAESELTDIERLQKFIVDSFEPEIDEITHIKYVNGRIMEDTQVEDIYLACKKNFDFNVNKNDVYSILNSSCVRRVNKLKEFIHENRDINTTGHIAEYANCIYPQSEYNVWAFTKWIVGTMHNWFCDYDDYESSPLTLVLTGNKHGSGKTSFCRHVLPKELSKYIIQSKLSDNKDAKFRLGKSLIVFDDEFGGKAFKDDKEYKELSNLTHITDRKSYGREDTTIRRRASLMATTNESDIIKDPTGNRRILPINVEQTDYEKMVSMDKTPMIIEAYNLYKSGYDWRIFREEDQMYIYENTTTNQVVIPMEEIFFNYYSIEQTFEFTTEVVVNQGDVLQFLNQNSGLKPTKYEIKEIFTKNKFNYQAHRLGQKVKKGVRLYMRNSDAKPENVISSTDAF